MKNIISIFLIAGVVCAFPFLSRAQDGGAADKASSEWSSIPYNAPNSDVPGGDFTNPDRAQFNVNMQQGRLSQVCRGLKINVQQGISNRLLNGSGVDVNRSLQLLPDNRLALVDEQDVNLDLSHWFQLAHDGKAAFGVILSAQLQGASLVVRPMPTQDSCKEIGRLFKLNDVKTVIPFTASRLSAMGVGELWKLPFVLNIAHTEAVDLPQPYPLPKIEESISFGMGQRGSAIMTVYRISKDKMRFRLRVDHARIKSASGEILETFPVMQLFTNPAGLLKGEINKIATGQLERYTIANFGFLSQKTNGQQMLVEFILDPRDPDQMAALAKIMQGDVKTLLLMAKRMVNLESAEGAAVGDYDHLKKKEAAGLGMSPAYNSEDIYKNAQKTVGLLLPFLVDWTQSRTAASDRIVRLGGQGGEFMIYRADKINSAGYFDIPLKGQLIKHDSQSSAQAFVYQSKTGVVSAPRAVYIQQDGFLRSTASGVRKTVDDINRVMELAGARGGAPNPGLAAPTAALLSEEPPSPAGKTIEAKAKSAPWTYHEGAVSFTLIFSPKAVAAILKADAGLIIRSFVNTIQDGRKQVLEWILKHGTIGADGRISFNHSAFHQRWDDVLGDQGVDHPIQLMDPLCETAQRIVADIAAVRQKSSPQAQARAFADLMAGRDRSGLAYKKILSVLVQLVDPADLTADLAMKVEAGLGGGKDVASQFVFKNGKLNEPLLNKAGKAKARFILPSQLVD
ncbi:MAG: hypothetical protein ACYCPQ_09045 [Elusimicrobiota bacterium]